MDLNPHIPQPSRQLSVDEFLAKLDSKNPAFPEVSDTFKLYEDAAIMRIFRKDSSMYEILTGSMGDSRLPIVDKNLQMVIEVSGIHEKLTGVLFAYHEARQGRDHHVYNDRIWGEMWLKSGYGYYFTGARGRPTIVIYPETYRPDRYDKDLLLKYGIE